ncbi:MULTISPECIES: AbrB/MazE/SpoVT family DNA-binding domain-containing protein [unclassified Paenibacillus]|uniref:AbrB/MazE/SpoVT family DNA-binding domain-containing protein n=1 Tax=unclassified Paenibacillus TaxID=185978 RepID=UPI00034EB0FE|nr:MULTISPECIES: AbrB/MazE/SpoVT family DNA-binding domain-containing protein [unclassified Paenibacillus]EPD80524.1 hypothetical protein HMPREF1207_05630 [Paenibacillus sp. HGH0039]
MSQVRIAGESEVKNKYQTTIPEDIRRKAELGIGDTLIWSYDPDTKQVSITAKPKSFSDALWGLGEEIWQKQTGDEYIRNERENW